MPGRVLRIITRLNRGGPLRQLTALVPELAERGWRGPVVTGRVEAGEPDGAADLVQAGADVRRLGTLQRGLSPVRDLRALRDLLALARAERPDLIHTHLGKAGALGRLVATRLGVPCVHTLHGHHLDLPGRGARWLRRAERVLGRRTTRLIVLSERQRRDVVEVHRVLPAAKVTVIPPGLDVDALRRAAGASFGAPRPPGPPLFVWSGRFVRVKDPLAVLDVVERLREPARVVALGAGPLLGRVRRAAARRGLLGRLELPGPSAAPAPLLAGATALFLTSRAEGTPLVALEAFALGVPVVAPTVGGLPDVVQHGQSGLWVPPGDPAALAAALERLACDDPLRTRLGAGARAAAEGFRPERLAAATAALYEQLAQGGGRARAAPRAG